MRITRLSDLRVLADLTRLTDLRLDWMRNVTSLPSFAGLRRLTDVTLDTMFGLSDLRPIAEAPALTRLSIVNMPQLAAAELACLRGHPVLAELSAYTGKAKVNAEIRKMFPDLADQDGQAWLVSAGKQAAAERGAFTLTNPALML